MDEVTKDQPAEEPKGPTVAEWVKKFDASEATMKKEFRPRYQLAKTRLRAEYEIRNQNSAKMTHDQVALVSSIGTNFVNSVYFKSPNCNLTAREEVEHDQVENTEIKVNDILKDKKAKKVIKRAIWDAYLGGFGAIFTDYEYEDTENPDVIAVPAQIDPITQQEIAPAQLGRIVLKNEITFQRIRPDLLRFPKGFDFDNYQDSPWLGFDQIIPIQDVRAQEDWDPNVREAIKGERYDKLSNSENQKTTGNDGDELYARISFCFVKPKTPMEKMILYVFCKGSEENFLKTDEFDKGHVGYPIKLIKFNPQDDDCSYPIGDPWLFESQSNAVDRWWKTYSKRVERNHPKNIYDMNAVSTPEGQQLKSNNDLQWVGIKNPQKKPLSDYFYQFQHPPIPREVTDFYTVARQLMSEIGPRAAISQGSQDPSTDPNTATEAKILQAGEMIDIDARTDDVAELIKDLVLDVAGILTKIAYPMDVTKEMPMDPLDPKSELVDVAQKIGKEGFTSKVNVDVEVESMKAQNKDVIRAQLERTIGLLTKIQPLMAVPSPKYPMGATLNWHFWLEKLFDTFSFKNIDEGILPLMAPPVPVGPDGQPMPEPAPTGEMPPEAIEAGMAERV